MTNSRDLVIQYFRTIFKGVTKIGPWELYSLQPNLNNSVDFADDSIGLNHYMSGYLQAYSGEIQSIMVNASKRHTLPGKLIGNGQITVNIAWPPSSNNPSEIDLHVFEPDNTHVYEYAKQGKFGCMDNNGSSTN